MTPSLVALIPARGGSKRVKDKNIRELNGHPLLAYTIILARLSGIFKDVIVSTENENYAEIAKHYGASVPFLRPAALAGDASRDVLWIDFTLRKLSDSNCKFDAFCILRPTSPFRTITMLQNAWRDFQVARNVDSLRAVQKCSEHPGKMWVVRHGKMLPLFPFETDHAPWHSTPYQSLPEVYIQNASLEIAWTRVLFETKTIAGMSQMPFFTRDNEGFDINTESDWTSAKQMISDLSATIPITDLAPFFGYTTK